MQAFRVSYSLPVDYLHELDAVPADVVSLYDSGIIAIRTVRAHDPENARTIVCALHSLTPLSSAITFRVIREAAEGEI